MFVEQLWRTPCLLDETLELLVAFLKSLLPLMAGLPLPLVLLQLLLLLQDCPAELSVDLLSSSLNILLLMLLQCRHICSHLRQLNFHLL